MNAKSRWWIVLIVVVAMGLLVMIALGPILAWAGWTTIVRSETSAMPTAIVSELESSPTPAVVLDEPVLVWEGRGAWGDEDTTRCKTLRIDAAGQMTLGHCGQAQTATPLNRPEFAEMLERFAAFELKTATDSLTFQGRGQLSDPAFQRALLSWVHWTFGESWSGRACAACRTVVSWHLGTLDADPSQCAHLTVLDYGYGYAEVSPCEGGPVESQAIGWLEPSEWVQLDEWLYGRSALHSGENYLAGVGFQSMTEAERNQLEGLVRSIYGRLSGLTVAKPSGSINGWVWHDLCASSAVELSDDQGGPTTPLPGCVEDSSGARRADGILIGTGGFAAQDLTLPPESDACPAATADTRLLRQPSHGYCLLYPVAFKVEKPNAMETDLVIGSLLNVQEPRVNIVAQKADDRTAAAVADQVLTDFQGFEIEQRTTTVGGADAIVLDKLPGQEINRRVILTHDGWLYELTFMPADEGLGAAFEGMEALYDRVINSFTFMPQSDEIVAGQDCLDPKADEQSLTYEAYNFCMLHPEGYSVVEGTANQVVVFVGSLQDVEHPKLFINVGDAADRTAEQVADELAAEVQNSIPGFQVERSFGLTVGYEPAWVLEDMPGQDISRQVVVVHGDQLYTLTFIPADPQMGDVYEDMEALYPMVTNSFRFLR